MRGPAIVRLAAGVAVSAIFLALTIARVDLAQLGEALRAVAPAGVLGAFGIVVIDLLVRAVRWRLLLRDLSSAERRPGLVTAAAYLAIGYLANSLLPARLGDLARAYLAGAAFGVSRAATLGTILVERLADGATMLGLAIASSLLVASVGEVRALAAYAILLAAGGTLGLAVLWFALSRRRVAAARIPRVARSIVGRVGQGVVAIRTVRGATLIGLITLAAAGTAVAVGWTVATAAGVPLSLLQAILFSSGIALSLAIPAAPASIGTYEFVGVVILTSFGASAEQALATVLVMRLVSTVPLSVLGLAAVWALHVRPATLFAPADAELIADLEGGAR